ncbi:uncharacterized protein LOC112528500 [Cynara cardunculus var. scolymus]|uniref:uncharacterized protein LOC112528500 n=1 Tax=Cynara cardunculus var. scolymus TaxID=59895 RepID=UPI000D62F6E6|nr:uncharacterized protein LOC112528500 [Cynara cardunculus var. scolymus]
MQMNKPTSSSSASGYGNQHRDSDHFVDQSVGGIRFKSNQCFQSDQNDNSNSTKPLSDSAGHADDDDEEEFLDCEDGVEDNHEGDGDFTFVCARGNNSSVPVDKPSGNGHIQPEFPLFDQNLLSGVGGNRLPIQPHVDKVFVESSHRVTSSTSEYDEIECIAAGPYCTWSKQSATDNPELSKKSNSTGFSKLWRFRGKVGRCNSDGRDAFVFLKRSDRSSTSSKSVAKRTTVGGSSVKANGTTGGGKPKVVKKTTKEQKANLSAHEVYLKKKEQTEEERRRSYLPYRPEILGFFTNVNGGLSRNVHPY